LNRALIAKLALFSLATWGCVRADVESAPPGDGAAVDAPDDGLSAAGGASGDGAADRPDDAPGQDGRRDIRGDGPGADGSADGRDGGASDIRRDSRADGGTDAPAPTCSDRIKNSDETDIDCGGHCGKCPAGKACIIGVDCIFGTCTSDHTCGACSVAADCPGVETECVHRSCTAGACGATREAVGKVLALQTTGDCKSRQCAADGTVMVVNDDTDLPDDRNPCSNDFCMAGTPSHTLLPLDSPCGGQNRCDASGQCVGCIVAGDCPGVDTACETRTCGAAGVCGLNLQPAGTRLPDPTPGDCKASECDGKGNIQVINEDRDLPVDPNLCTTDECSLGTPAHRPVPSGTGCGSGMVCDGANRCVECLSATTCPGSDTDCHTRTCFNGACGISNRVSGTPTGAQTPNDCKRSQCDGLGGVVNVSDPNDLPFDDNPCTLDLCNGDAPSFPATPSGSGCGGTSVCDGQGVCVGCLTASTCPGSDTECHLRTCVNHACGLSNAPAGMALFSQTNGDCKKNQCDGSGTPQVVNDDNDVPVDGNPCSQDLCTDGTPSNPLLPSGASCGNGLLCNDIGACVGCRTPADCSGSDTACQARTCSTAGECGVRNVAAGVALAAQISGDCKRDQCDGSGHIVTVPDDGDRPIDGNDCTQDLCSLGTPSNPSEPQDTPCSQSGGLRCNGRAGAEACVQCNAASQCTGGPDTECRARTCSAAGSCGIAFAAAGTVLSVQVAGDCKRDQCDGSGQVVSMSDGNDLPVDGNGCTEDVCSGSVPSNPFLPARTPCSDNQGSLCDGRGACVQCLAAPDCPGGPDTECRMRTCNAAGRCGIAVVAQGSALANQVVGNCHRDVCDGAGGVSSMVDDSDVFVDGNTCTRDVCSGGTPSNPVAARGTACNDNPGVVCDGAGTCVQCLTDAECDSSRDTPCNKVHCVLGACPFVPEMVNQPLPDPKIGDCRASACDGTGGISSVVDDNDVPPNANPCISLGCLGGVPTSQFLRSGTSCSPDGSLSCDGAGNCV
jgi:hypothetical protein